MEASDDASAIFVSKDTLDRIDPFVVMGVPLQETMSGAVADAMDEFTADWQTSSWSDVSERAMRTSVDKERKPAAANDALMELMTYCPKGFVCSAQMHEKCLLKPESALSNYAMKLGSWHSSMEKAGLCTCTGGTRTAIVFNTDELLEGCRFARQVPQGVAEGGHCPGHASLLPAQAHGLLHHCLSE